MRETISANLPGVRFRRVRQHLYINATYHGLPPQALSRTHWPPPDGRPSLRPTTPSSVAVNNRVPRRAKLVRCHAPCSSNGEAAIGVAVATYAGTVTPTAARAARLRHYGAI